MGIMTVPVQLTIWGTVYRAQPLAQQHTSRHPNGFFAVLRPLQLGNVDDRPPLPVFSLGKRAVLEVPVDGAARLPSQSGRFGDRNLGHVANWIIATECDCSTLQHQQ